MENNGLELKCMYVNLFSFYEAFQRVLFSFQYRDELEINLDSRKLNLFISHRKIIISVKKYSTQHFFEDNLYKKECNIYPIDFFSSVLTKVFPIISHMMI